MSKKNCAICGVEQSAANYARHVKLCNAKLFGVLDLNDNGGDDEPQPAGHNFHGGGIGGVHNGVRMPIVSPVFAQQQQQQHHPPSSVDEVPRLLGSSIGSYYSTHSNSMPMRE